jgi:hypothetical protein
MAPAVEWVASRRVKDVAPADEIAGPILWSVLFATIL